MSDPLVRHFELFVLFFLYSLSCTTNIYVTERPNCWLFGSSIALCFDSLLIFDLFQAIILCLMFLCCFFFILHRLSHLVCRNEANHCRVGDSTSSHGVFESCNGTVAASYTDSYQKRPRKWARRVVFRRVRVDFAVCRALTRHRRLLRSRSCTDETGRFRTCYL